MEQYLKRDVAKMIGEPIRKIQFWTDQGLVIPDIFSSGGKGISKIYSERNLTEFKMVQVLKDRLDRGIQLHIMKDIFDGLRKGEYDRGTKVIDFKDFYTNANWGITKELIFIFHGWAGPRGFHIIEKNKYGSFSLHPSIFASAIKNAMAFTTLMLGNVRNIALKRT